MAPRSTAVPTLPDCPSTPSSDRTGPPVRRPVMTQRWADVVFLHWRFDPDVVQRLLPTGVEVDTHDGAAWVGLVPFRMERLGFPGLAPLPFVGSFPEVNVRTYVRSGGRRGVRFFSLDVDRWLPTLVARATYRLPYCTGATTHDRVGDQLVSRVERRWPRHPAARALVRVGVGGPIEPDDTDRFLTDRWGLVAGGGRRARRWAPVDHPPWPLHGAELLELDETLVTAAGLPRPSEPPRLLWSPGVDVRVGRPRPVRPRRS